MDRELGKCIIARGIAGVLVTPAPTVAPIPSPPPPPVTDLSEYPNVAPEVEVSDDTWLVVIIACSSVGGTILLLCVLGIMCCMGSATEEVRSTAARPRPAPTTRLCVAVVQARDNVGKHMTLSLSLSL